MGCELVMQRENTTKDPCSSLFKIRCRNMCLHFFGIISYVSSQLKVPSHLPSHFFVPHRTPGVTLYLGPSTRGCGRKWSRAWRRLGSKRFPFGPIPWTTAPYICDVATWQRVGGSGWRILEEWFEGFNCSQSWKILEDITWDKFGL